MSGFTFDRTALDRAVKQAANDGVRKVANNYQRMLDDLASTYSGHPLEEVKAALQAAWRRLGGELTDPELTRFAQLTKDGERIEFRVQQI